MNNIEKIENNKKAMEAVVMLDNMNRKLMIIMAHPDDAELCCFGTINKYFEKGYECKLLIATDGSNSSYIGQDKKHTVDRLEETKSAFNTNGINISIECMRLTDGRVVFDIDTNAVVRKAIMDYKPEIVITHYPDETGVEHQDHTAIAKAVINSAIKTKNSIKMVLMSEPLLCEQTSFRANYFVETSKWQDAKVRALHKHVSQTNRYYMTDEYFIWKSSHHSMALPPKDINRSYEAFQLFVYIDE